MSAPDAGDVLLAFVIGVTTLCIGWVLAQVFGAFRRFDPGRSKHAVEVAEDGRFTLTLPPAPNEREVYVRFELGAGDTDDYDLAAGAEIDVAVGAPGRVAPARVERAAGTGAPGLGFAEPSKITTLHAVSTSEGSFLLATVPRASGCTISGVVRAGGTTKIARAWVYVPVEG